MKRLIVDLFVEKDHLSVHAGHRHCVSDDDVLDDSLGGQVGGAVSHGAGVHAL